MGKDFYLEKCQQKSEINDMNKGPEGEMYKMW